MSDFSLTLVLQIKTSKIINDMAKVQQKSEKITAFGGIFFVLDKFDSLFCPLWNQGHRQSQEFSVQIHRRPCQVDQNGTTIQTQHLLQQTIQHNLGARID